MIGKDVTNREQTNRRVAGTVLLASKDLISPKGRVGRVSYLANWLIFNVLFYALLTGATFVASMVDEQTLENYGWLLAPLALVAFGVVYVLFCIHAKRLHDLGLTGFVCLVMFAYPVLKAVLMLNGSAFSLPVDVVRWTDIFAKTTLGLSLMLQLALLVLPGRREPNGYGANPKLA